MEAFPEIFRLFSWFLHTKVRQKFKGNFPDKNKGSYDENMFVPVGKSNAVNTFSWTILFFIWTRKQVLLIINASHAKLKMVGCTLSCRNSSLKFLKLFPEILGILRTVREVIRTFLKFSTLLRNFQNFPKCPWNVRTFHEALIFFLKISWPADRNFLEVLLSWKWLLLIESSWRYWSLFADIFLKFTSITRNSLVSSEVVLPLKFLGLEIWTVIRSISPCFKWSLLISWILWQTFCKDLFGPSSWRALIFFCRNSMNVCMQNSASRIHYWSHLRLKFPESLKKSFSVFLESILIPSWGCKSFELMHVVLLCSTKL